MSEIRIDQLPTTTIVDDDHQIPSMRSSQTYKLTLGQISDLIISRITGQAPQTLDTLQEIAAAIQGNDTDIASLTSSIAAITAESLGVPNITMHHHSWDTRFATNSTSLVDVTGSSFSFTPSSATSKLIVMAMIHGDHRVVAGGVGYTELSMTQGATTTYIPERSTQTPGKLATFLWRSATGYGYTQSLVDFIQLSSASQVTFKLQALTTNDWQYVNRSFGDDSFSIAGVSGYTILEVH